MRGIEKKLMVNIKSSSFQRIGALEKDEIVRIRWSVNSFDQV